MLSIREAYYDLEKNIKNIEASLYDIYEEREDDKEEAVEYVEPTFYVRVIVTSAQSDRVVMDETKTYQAATWEIAERCVSRILIRLMERRHYTNFELENGILTNYTDEYGRARNVKFRASTSKSEVIG